jgi:hypothetical protein
MRITIKDLEKRLNVLKQVSGIENLQLDYNSVYGGYILVMVNPQTGGHHSAFGMSECGPRVKANEMFSKINCLIAGIEFAKQMN